MSLRTRISLALALWFACEAVAFALVVEAVGLGGAIVIGILTSMVGASMLKRVGTSALTRLRRDAGSGKVGVLRGDLALDGTLAGIGAFLLLMPGFVTDIIGLALAIPVVRGLIGARLRGSIGRPAQHRPQAPHGPTTIDLDPGDWRPADDARNGTMPKV